MWFSVSQLMKQNIEKQIWSWEDSLISGLYLQNNENPMPTQSFMIIGVHQILQINLPVLCILDIPGMAL